MITEKYLKECNLILTATNTLFDFARVGFDTATAKVNYDNCITLYDLAKKFNDLYVAFYKEYTELEKLDLGEKVEFSYYSPATKEYDCKSLCLCVKNPTFIDRKSVNLHLNNCSNRIATVAEYRNEKGYPEIEKVKLDNKLVRKYLNLFDKYALLFDMYNAMVRKNIIGGQYYHLTSNIDEYYKKSEEGYTLVGGGAEILDGLSKLIFSLGPCYNIIFNLGENFGIDYENSTINWESTPEYNEDYDTLANKVYVNQKRLMEK